MLAGTNIRKIRNWPNSPNIIARQNFLIYSMHNLFCVCICIYFCFVEGGGGGELPLTPQIKKGQGSVRTAFCAYV